MHLCFTHHVVITSHPSANEHMRCYTTIFESVLVSIQLNHPMLVPVPSGSAIPCWFLHHPAQSPRVGSYTIRLSRPCRFLWHQAQSPRVGSYAIQLHHPVLVPTPSGSVAPCRFLCHPAQSPRAGSYAIRLSHPVLVPTPSSSVTPCLFLHHPAKSSRVGFYTIRLSHLVLVSTPSHDRLISCWFLHHPTIILFRVGFYTISRSSHFVLVSTPSHDHLISCWFLHHLTIVSSVSLTLYHVTLSAILAYKPHDPGLEVRS